jgi:predicted transcriptional regulator
MNEKEAAESICDIIKSTGEDGQTMMIDALAMFFDKEFGSKDEFAEGMAYAEKAGRIKRSESQVWLVK